MHHAKAVSHLMQQRGPEAHKQDWDKAMLVAFRGLTVSLPLPVRHGRPAAHALINTPTHRS